MNTSAAFKPLSKDDIAGVLGVSCRTIENWVNDGTLPAPKRLGNRVYWHPGVFFGWLEQRLVSDETATPSQPLASESPQEQPAVPRQSRARHGRTDIERLRSRDQAKLRALAD